MLFFLAIRFNILWFSYLFLDTLKNGEPFSQVFVDVKVIHLF